MTDSSDKNNDASRKTISIKPGGGGMFRRASSSTGKTVEIEIKRRKRGLSVDIDEPNSNFEKISNKSESSVNLGNLTDQEFKTRVKALQEAMKEEETDYSASRLSSGQNEFEAESLKILDERNPSPLSVSVKEPEPFIRPERRNKRKEEKFNSQSNTTQPVVFRAREHLRKASNLDKNLANNKKKEFEQNPPTLNSDFPNILLNKTQPSRFKAKSPEDLKENVSSRKKIKVVVRERAFPKKSQSSGKISRTILDRVLNNDFEERTRSEASLRRAKMKLKNSINKEFEVVKVVREVLIPDNITIAELANRMAARSSEIIKYLLSIGTIATVNQTIDADTAEIICSEFGHIPKRVSDSDIENEVENIVDDPKDMHPRAPIVAIMGHVDHGKTTLLDAIRKTGVAQKEAGGITQHVAAYQIETTHGKKITFIDTPGHAAFSNIRKRGAVITDIIVLVVAADDGIKEQTIEVISQAKTQNVPIIVAINKVDRPNINIDKVKAELMAREVILEDFGGDVLSVEISALKNTNLNNLLDTILLQAEILDLKANPNRKAVGTVIESRIDKGKGIVSSIIVQHGTIKYGEAFVAGASFGKVRTIYDYKGKKITSAGPSSPIELIGFDSAPEPGDILSVIDSEQMTREIAEYRKTVIKSSKNPTAIKSIEQLMAGENLGAKELNILIKADVFGSLEAIVASIELIQHPEIKTKIVEKSLGAITESDVDFAKNTRAVIVGFNVNITSLAKSSAKLNNITILSQNIIYRITEEIKQIMGTMLSPIVEENYIGAADVRKIFVISRYGTIAGCYVPEGIIKRADSKIKVIRDGKLVFEGKIRSMKHEKDEIKESRQGHECGILAEGYNDFKEGDKIECYEIVLKQRSMD
ncbi:MAG: translation initiation factor IF-2 [Holosporales bacterium]|jgi:translation initiation factor IF-2|nr:translation initiation factor IF-2 [Holosporales bacterium]